MHTIDLVFLEQLRDLSGPVGQGIVQKIVQIFLTNSPALLDSIEEAIKCHAYPQAGVLAHKLKSGAGNIGAFRLIQLLEPIESCDVALSHIERIKLFDEIQIEFKKIKIELIKYLDPSS